MMRDMNASWAPWKGFWEDNGQLVTQNPIFYVDLSVANQAITREAAQLKVGLASWFDLKGEYVETKCHLVPAIMEYDVVINADTISMPHQSDLGRVL